MTQRTVVECDWHRCDRSSPVFDNDESNAPQDWGVLIDGNDDVRHFCPKHTFKALRWCAAGVSEAEHLEVKHEIIEEHPDLEAAHVHTRNGTHGMHIAPFIDEPPTTFEEFDPPLGSEEQETEAWGFHVFDHLHVTIIGSHKSEPVVVVESDEFPTHLEIRDNEGSFIIPQIDEAFRLIDKRHSYGEDMQAAARHGARAMFEVLTDAS